MRRHRSRWFNWNRHRRRAIRAEPSRRIDRRSESGGEQRLAKVKSVSWPFAPTSVARCLGLALLPNLGKHRHFDRLAINGVRMQPDSRLEGP